LKLTLKTFSRITIKMSSRFTRKAFHLKKVIDNKFAGLGRKRRK
jgi:hypothetical protein